MAMALIMILSLVLIAALLFVFWLMMLIDSITRKFKDSSDKVIWVIINIFLGILGALIYYFVVFYKDKNKSIKWLWWTLLVLGILAIISFIVFVSLLVNLKAG
ncbi:PLDc N-terminal domain-containing protein [Candidatus Pacearchaeota archaeon]|nr:PLDc N-terminal domain-containing protein [Candidatus Pacearchaeota archaeon]